MSISKTITVLLIIAFSGVLLSFTNSTDTNSKWTILLEKEGIIIHTKTQEYKFKEGIIHEYNLLKFENTTNNDVELSWKLDIYVNGNCRTCNLTSPNEYEFKLKVKAGATIEGKIESMDKRFAIFSNDLSKEKFNKSTFEINKLLITKI
ncbi:MAG: hypothetical protein K9J13_06295 [Saprospiraceae bacterium]|nr:hypothetical protein [Saprospiraceae bacterium]